MLFSSTTSIDLGSKNIKIIQGSRKGKNVYIEKAISIPTPPASFNEGNVTNAEAIAESLKSAFEKNGIKPGRIIFTSSSASVILRKISIPGADKKDMETMVNFELNQYLHIDSENYIIKYVENGITEEEGVKKQKLMVAVYPKIMMQGYKKVLSILGKKPYILDMNSNCIYKLFRNDCLINGENYTADSTVAVIDIGYYYVDINIISKGLSDFDRIIPLGDRLINTAAARDLEVSEAYVERMKIEDYHLYSDENMDNAHMILDNAVRTNLENLSGEIRRVFQYYKNSKPGNVIHRVYIHGGGAGLKGIDIYMQDALSLPVMEVENMSCIDASKLEEVDISQYLNAAGALIRL